MEWLEGSDGSTSSGSTSCFGPYWETSHRGLNSFDLNSMDAGRDFRDFGVVSAGEELVDDGLAPLVADGGFLKIRGTAVGEGVAGGSLVEL